MKITYLNFISLILVCQSLTLKIYSDLIILFSYVFLWFWSLIWIAFLFNLVMFVIHKGYTAPYLYHFNMSHLPLVRYISPCLAQRIRPFLWSWHMIDHSLYNPSLIYLPSLSTSPMSLQTLLRPNSYRYIYLGIDVVQRILVNSNHPFNIILNVFRGSGTNHTKVCI